jgi:Ca2+-binding RTX toxin-like protein
MFFQTACIIIGLSIFAILATSFVNVSATKLNFSDDFTSNFTNNLKSKINNLVAGALNDTDNLINSSILLSNNSNLSSNQIVISNNKVISTMNTNSTGNSLIKDKVTTINGVCNSEKIAGNGNDTLLSSGNCNDQLTGGAGADKFACGEGNDTIKDYNPKEGDVILDQKNCENVE